MQTYLYDNTKSFEFNATFGPFWNQEFPKINGKDKSISLFGNKLNSPFGIPACPLTANSRFIKTVSKLGYDLLTYKTMRSKEWYGHDLPNWIHIDQKNSLNKEELKKTIKSIQELVNEQEPTTANSFGVASPKPEYWIEDFNLANQNLKEGQLLILSLMTSPLEERSQLEDAEYLAKLANQTTANLVEINLACPNTGAEGLIYQDLEASTKICKKMKKILKDKPLLVKVGYYSNQIYLKKFMEMTAGIIDGISSTNTYGMKVINEEGKASFGENRPIAGVSGAAIRNLSMHQAESFIQFKKELNLKDLILIGIGGATKPEHIEKYLEIGANAVQAAVGPWVNPWLAKEYKES